MVPGSYSASLGEPRIARVVGHVLLGLVAAHSMMPPIPDRRKSGKFIESLSLLLVIASSLGALLVLVDPVIALKTDAGTIIKLGGEGFSDQIKGAVVALILVAGFSAVVSYWLGSSDQGGKAQESVNTIAQASAPTTAAAVAAATGSPPVAPVGPLQAENVAIQTDNVQVNQPKEP